MAKVEYPVEVLPKLFGEEAKTYTQISSGHFDSVATIMLNVAGFVLADHFDIEVKPGWVEPANLWSISVGSSGSGKSHRLDRLFKGVVNLDSKIREKEEEEKKFYLWYKKAVKEIRGYIEKNENHSLVEHFVQKIYDNSMQHLITDTQPYKFKDIDEEDINKYEPYIESATIEAVYKILEKNQGKTTMFKYDEILGLYRSLGQYKQGGEQEQSFVKLFDTSKMKISRVDDTRNRYIEKKYVSIAGTTQKTVLHQIFNDERIANGNVFRYLFTIDDFDERKNPFILNGKNDQPILTFFDWVVNTMLTETVTKRRRLTLSPEQREIISKWREDFNKTDHTIDNQLYDSIMGKMDRYVPRLSLILNRIRTLEKIYNAPEEHRDMYFNEVMTQDSLCVDNADVENAIKLINYYFQQTIIVYDVIQNKNMGELSEEVEFYENILPDHGTYSDFITSYKVWSGKSAATAKRRYSAYRNKNLIKLKKVGWYKTIK